MIKQFNPDLPVLIREATGTPARVFARFGAPLSSTRKHTLLTDAPTERGREAHVELDGLSAAEVEARVSQLLQ